MEARGQAVFAKLRKADKEGTDQVLDAVNTLARNPTPSGAHRYGKDTYRMRVGFYRVLYSIVKRDPVVISIEHVGRSGRP